MTEPLVTFITIARNAARTIETTLQSVARQNWPHMEYIVIDGASTDSTQAIIERYRDTITHYISEPDNGPYDATEKGYRLATGDIVGLVHADDWIEPGMAKALADAYAGNPEADMFSFGVRIHHEQPGGALTEGGIYRDPPEEAFSMESGCYCQGVNRFYSRRLIKREGQFAVAQYGALADREFYVRIASQAVRKSALRDTLYHFRVHPGSYSTGGDPSHIARGLGQTVQIAQDILKMQLTPHERRVCKHWYGFNMVRLVYFLLRSGAWGKALHMGLGFALRHPLLTLRSLICWRMPPAYRIQLA